MANTYRVTHCFQGQGGTSDDMYCNQFYFFSTAQAPEDVATWGPELAAHVHLLWVSGVGTPISFYYHPRCLGNNGVTKIYDVTGNPATSGPPIFYISDSTLIPADDYLDPLVADVQGLPEEVAVCLSYQAIHTEGDLPRRRGRIYLGPLNIYACKWGTGSEFDHPTQVADGLISHALAAAVTMQASAAANDFEWRVFSTMDGFAFKIVNFSMDDAFDTIRGRGGAPTARTTLPIS